MPPTVFLPTKCQILYQWCVTTQIWVVIGWRKFSTNSKPSSKNTPFISILLFFGRLMVEDPQKAFLRMWRYLNVKFGPLSWIDVFLSWSNHRIKPPNSLFLKITIYGIYNVQNNNIRQAPSNSKMLRLCFCLKMLHLVIVVSQRLYYVLDNFFSHVIWHWSNCYWFLVTFRKVNVHDWTAYFNFFFCYFRKKKKEGTVEGDKSFVIILLFKKCNRCTVIIIFWSLDGRISDLTLSFLDQVLGRLYFVT